MAVVIIVAVSINMAVIRQVGAKKMKNPEKPEKPAAIERAQRAESLLAEMFERAGWRVERKPNPRSRLDMIVRRPGVVYAVEVKVVVRVAAIVVFPSFHNQF